MFQDGGHTARHNCVKWNGKLAGKEAFTSINGQGYIQGRILNQTYRAHRVICAMVHGECHGGEIDHKNGIRDRRSGHSN